MQNDQVLQTSIVRTDQPSPANFAQSPGGSSTSCVASTHEVRTRFYYPELDAVRLFLFFGVWSYHALPRYAAFYTARHVPSVIASSITTVIRAGMCSLDVFFVLSAYLITELLLREREANGTLDLKTFYVRRLL